MAKIHLFISSRPIRPGETLIAKCHDVVRQVQILHAWDDIPVAGGKVKWPTVLGQCRECFSAKTYKGKGRVFCYAIQSREYHKSGD